MRIAYLDLFSGISGDMTIAAFLDAGLSFAKLSKQLKKLKLKNFSISKSKVKRNGIAGTKFDVKISDNAHCRSTREIFSIIDRSELKDSIKNTAKGIFKIIGRAEAGVHGVSGKDAVSLHELGDMDSIIDIVGTAIAIDELGIDKVYSSNISLGRGFVNTRHGVLPVTAPAALEILKGIPVDISEIDAELVTPTGAGIVKTLSAGFGRMPLMKIDKIGYGAGTHIFSERPNMLRIVIGEAKESFLEDRIDIIETNIDDMNPQNFEYVVERLFKEGALDAYTAPVQMKKSRHAVLLTVLAKPGDTQRLSSLIFAETTTIGVRVHAADRFKLDRKLSKVKTKYGDVPVKISRAPGGMTTSSPEYDECVKIARAKKVPLKMVYEEAKRLVKVLFFLCILYSASCALSYADTVTMNDGAEQRGIVVEDYRDRIVLSTADGEKAVMKSEIQELYFDSEEDNLIKLAEQSRERKDYIKAFAYYDKALKVNPNSKLAHDGVVFLQGYLFRKETAQKEEDVKRREDAENFGAMIKAEASEAEKMKGLADRLKKTIGITLEMKDGLPVVTGVTMKSAAYLAGIRNGDRIVAIWARLTGYLSLGEVLDMLLDKPSLELKCTLERTVDVNMGFGNNIQASFSMEFDGLTVSGVKDGGTAFNAGLKKGDLITAIDGKSTRYMPIKKALAAIKAAQDGRVELTLRRETLIWRTD
jgi:hypothetical protein